MSEAPSGETYCRNVNILRKFSFGATRKVRHWASTKQEINAKIEVSLVHLDVKVTEIWQK